jgi:hypothetical protein
MCIEEAIGILSNSAEVDFDPAKPFDKTKSKLKPIFENFNKFRDEYSTIKETLSGVKDISIEGLELLPQEYSIDAKRFLEEQLHEIANYETGRKLLLHVAELIEKEKNDSSSTLKINITNKTSDAYNRENNTLSLNFWDKLTTRDRQTGKFRVFTAYPTIQGKTSLNHPDGFVEENLIESKLGLSPLFISVFHELNHYKDNKDGAFKDRREQIARDAKEKRFSYEDPATRVRGIIDAMSEDTKFSEHKTIFDGSDTSEFNLRLEANEPLRYLYQENDGKSLYEPVKTVIRHASSFKPEQCFDISNKLWKYIDKLPNISIDLTKPDLEHMKVRLINRLNNTREFQEVFNQLMASNVAGIPIYQSLVRNRTSQARAVQVNDSIQKTCKKLQDLESSDWQSKNWSKSAIVSLHPDVKSKEHMRTMLKRRLELRLGRRNNELDILKQLRIPRGSKFPYTPDVFYKIAGIPTPGVQEAPVRFTSPSSPSSPGRSSSPSFQSRKRLPF